MSAPGIKVTPDGVLIGGRDGKDKVGFLGASEAAQQDHVAKVAITYTASDPSITTDGAITIADGSSPTVDELLEFCEELNDKIEDLTEILETFGFKATS